jgi:hypothetical protein
MTNHETQQVASWLEGPEVRPGLELLVRSWNDHELLGIDLADQLRELVTKQASKVSLERNLIAVDWAQLAEKYAEEIVQVDEDELIRRREAIEAAGR